MVNQKSRACQLDMISFGGGGPFSFLFDFTCQSKIDETRLKISGCCPFLTDNQQKVNLNPFKTWVWRSSIWKSQRSGTGKRPFSTARWYVESLGTRKIRFEMSCNLPFKSWHLAFVWQGQGNILGLTDEGFGLSLTHRITGSFFFLK